jgi:hypothetical protein
MVNVTTDIQSSLAIMYTSPCLYHYTALLHITTWPVSYAEGYGYEHIRCDNMTCGLLGYVRGQWRSDRYAVNLFMHIPIVSTHTMDCGKYFNGFTNRTRTL